jgi:hypothetical protein
METNTSELRAENPKQTRKTITQLRADYNLYRLNFAKVFVHTKTNEEYQIITICWDEETNEPCYVYCYVSMTWMKFTRPCKEFLQKFHERGTA